MKKSCDNCTKELSKFAFFSPYKKIYRHNNAILCLHCFIEISKREHLEENRQIDLLATPRWFAFRSISSNFFIGGEVSWLV